MLIPVGAIAAGLLAGIMEQTIGWNYICVILAGMALVMLVLELIKLPLKVTVDKSAKVDFISMICLAGGLVLLTVALLSFSQTGFMPAYASFILLGVSFGLLVCFYFYDQKCSKNKIFFPEMFNRTVIVDQILIGLVTLVNYCERFQVPYNLALTHGLDSMQIGYCMAIVGCQALLFSPIGSIVYSKIIARNAVLVFCLIYSGFLLLNIL